MPKLNHVSRPTDSREHLLILLVALSLGACGGGSASVLSTDGSVERGDAAGAKDSATKAKPDAHVLSHVDGGKHEGGHGEGGVTDARAGDGAGDASSPGAKDANDGAPRSDAPDATDAAPATDARDGSLVDAGVDVAVAGVTELTVTMKGNPSNASFTVTEADGPHTFSAPSGDATVIPLPAGMYPVMADPVVSAGYTYTPTVTTSPATVTAGQNTNVTVSFAQTDHAPVVIPNTFPAQTLYVGAINATTVPFTVSDVEDLPGALVLSGPTCDPTILICEFAPADPANPGQKGLIIAPVGTTATTTQVTFKVVDSTGTPEGTTAVTVPVTISTSAIVTSAADDGGPTTLRGVIQWINANAATAAGATITFALPGQVAGGSIPITLTSPMTTVSQPMTIAGPANSTITIEGSGTKALFTAKAALTFQNLTFDRGFASGSGGSAGSGGAISTNSALTLTSCAFTNNTAATSGGAIYSTGGLTITDSSFTSNSAPSAGAIYDTNGPFMTVTDSTFTSNAATAGYGGAVDFEGVTTITGTTFSLNHATQGAGAAEFSYITKVTNSTFSGNYNTMNTPPFLGGSAIVFNQGGEPTVSMWLSFVTVTGSQGSPALFAINATATLQNCLISGNLSGDLQADSGTGVFNSGGYNLIDNASLPLGPGDEFNQPAVALGPLMNNGGPTSTIALPSGHPAIGKIPVAACLDGDGNAVTVDQRRGTRPAAAHPTTCDIGAFER